MPGRPSVIKLERPPDARTSDRMRRVRQRDTQPELLVRRRLHGLGYRYRLHRKDLPGVPDIVLPRYKAVVFVHGCFWHGHACARGRLPKSNTDYWHAKIERNVARDRRNVCELQDLGWRVFVVWACQMDEGLFDVFEFLERLRKGLDNKTVNWQAQTK